MNKPIRIGRIHFTNVWPIFYYFPFHRFGNQIECISQVPTQLNQAMAKGDIDMGPISSFAYAENFENYVLFPDLSVSAKGEVGSILLFHRKPLNEIASGTIALPTTSATSVNLLKIIMEKRYQGQPNYTYMPPDLDAMMLHQDAALLIGDDAIRAKEENTAYEVTDLGEEWYQFTKQWMTFAVWAVRKDTITKHAKLTQQLYDTFIESKALGLQHPSDMVAEAHRTLGGTRAFWEHYFQGLLTYEFGPEQKQGLQLYYQYAYELGLLPKQVKLNMWDNKSVI
jgi:chorismate dehydratase